VSVGARPGAVPNPAADHAPAAPAADAGQRDSSQSDSGQSDTGSRADCPLDCLIVGAGPAGLTAATYLVRFHRRIGVVDAGHSRARWIPTSHNCPGFPFGVSGTELIDKLRTQAEGYGAVITTGRVETLRREPAADGQCGLFIATDDAGRQWRARCVLLATGIVDRMPTLHGPAGALEDAIAAGTIRLCAVCDGYEASDEAIAVYGPVDTAIQHGLFLRTFSRSVTVLRSQSGEPSATNAQLAKAARITLLPVPARLQQCDGQCEVTLGDLTDTDSTPDDRHVRRFDTVYPVLGGDPQTQLAVGLGARVDDEGELVADAKMQTSVDGLYAIGDVVSSLNQISVAVGHAAIAATTIHNRLPPNYREDEFSQPATAPDTPAPADASPDSTSP